MQAAVLAILLMSSVSANAMEFGDRPGVSSPIVSHSVTSVDQSRRQIDTLAQFNIAGSKLADRPRPISIGTHTSFASLMKDGPGRLSPEFTAISEGSHIRLDSKLAFHIRRKPTGMPEFMSFEDRPGNSSNGYANITTASIEGYSGPHPRVRLQLQPTTVLALSGR